MRLLISSLVLAALLLPACTNATPEPLPTPVPTNAFVPVPTSILIPTPQRAGLLRIAILGETTTANVWEIFDESGSSFWNTATQADFWPSLYQLAPPASNFQPAAALGEASPVKCDPLPCASTVVLKPDLVWTDGSPLTAEDVAFTVNTALDFQLGLNWKRAYNPDVLDHAEAVNESNVKFIFKGQPAVADWQYGILLGPIVNRGYWQPRVDNLVQLLPDDTLLHTILELEVELARIQSTVDDLNQTLIKMDPTSSSYAETSRAAKNFQDELNSIYNKLQKNRSEYDAKLAEARAALFELSNENEPTLGPWTFASRIEGEFEKQANPDAPFSIPWFDRVVYLTYASEQAAVRALQLGEVDILLLPGGLSPGAVSRLEDSPEVTLSRNISRSARFLALNHYNPYLADPNLHQALACMFDPQVLVESTEGLAAPLTGFVLDENRQNRVVSMPCSGFTGVARLAEAVRLLKSAGYTWDREPGEEFNGVGLKSPGGFAIPPMRLIIPEEDSLRKEVADYIASRAGFLGLIVEVKSSSSDDLFYAVYGSRDYDMALLGWRLSVYPSYLCDWFLPWDQNPMGYSGIGLQSVCEEWSQTSDLDEAKAFASEVQHILMRDLPLIPLYSGVRVDAYRNIRYPFSDSVDGLEALFGAPELARPIPQ